MIRFLSLVLVCMSLASVSAQEKAASFNYELTESRFKELAAELQPGEPLWRSIPWRVSLLQAQRDAIAQQKPIFIWAMDGHPLGCT